jgi:hypothetical protein
VSIWSWSGCTRDGTTRSNPADEEEDGEEVAQPAQRTRAGSAAANQQAKQRSNIFMTGRANG